MKRSKHSLSHYKLATFDMGELVPVGVFDVLPGDSVQQATSALVRVSPLNAPVMHPVSVRIHHWFVPMRLLWDGWEEFITGGSDGNNADSPPMFDSGVVASKTLLDYMGIPPGTDMSDTPIQKAPVRAYNLIMNEFYRDQDLQSERDQDTILVGRVAWEKDYFTSSRPWPQKGADVTLPLGTVAPVRSTGETISFDTIGQSGLALQTQNGSTAPSWSGSGVGGSSQSVRFGSTPGLEANLEGATAVDVNTVRRAFALQRYQEARAQYGSRYTEYLRYLGVRSSDARLQRPEYLGGGKQTISFSEVLQTAPTTDGDDELGIGNLKGHGISAMRSRRYRRFFEEHGWVLSLMSVRPRAMYADGIHRMWTRETKEDYWQRELEMIGQQEVKFKEVYSQHSTPEVAFGFNDRYAEYRHMPSTIAAEFRDTLDFWHMARMFAADPALNSTFITCEPTKRINQVGGDANTLWCMVNHSIQARRLVSKGGRPGRII